MQTGRRAALFLACMDAREKKKKEGELVTEAANRPSTLPLAAWARLEGATANYKEARADEVADRWRRPGRETDATLRQEAVKVSSSPR